MNIVKKKFVRIQFLNNSEALLIQALSKSNLKNKTQL